MRRLLLFVLMFFLSITMMANPVDPDKAVQVAKNHVKSQVKIENYNASIVYTHPMPKTGEPAFYVVNVGSSAFVLVAADDIAHPVLGYSMSRSWPTGNADGSSASSRDEQIALPSQITAFLDDLASQIEAARQQGIAPDRNIASEWSLYLSGSSPMLGEGDPQGGGVCQTPSSSLPDSVGPLLTTTWDQGQYYNALCPEDAGGPAGHTYTGCVATAMAQIINYWGYPAHGRGIHSYNHPTYGTLTVNYDSANYDYAHMPNTLTSTSTPQEVQAVATLMRDCGVAANMGYGPSESSSFDVDARAGMINFFRLNPDLSYAEKSFFADSVWENMLRTDIADGRPVMYSGQGDAGGHSFVCDGYKDSNYFHFNFGWGGYANGWYTTTAVNPAGMNFNSSQSAILAIQPDSTGNVILGQMGGTSTFIVDEPLEFYHLLGHNAYSGTNYSNSCDNTVYFISADSANQLVADIIELEDQYLTINSGTETRSLCGVCENNLSPMVSSDDALYMTYSGNFYYTGFKVNISQNNSCRMVSNIVTTIDTTTVNLTWIENGTASQWQIEYGLSGFEIGTGTRQTVYSTIYDISGLQKFTEYDIYIRSICESNQVGLWNVVKVQTIAPYWTDIVTSQPNGYVYDETTNTVEISTAEGFAWFASVANGLNGMPHDEVQWSERKVKLINDIDLSTYRWLPIKNGFCGGELDGQGHTIRGLYVKEDDDAGLFSNLWCSNTVVKNLNIENCYIYSGYRAGGIAATFDLISLYNCSVSGTIYGHFLAGGLAAFAADCEIINSFTNCNVTGNIQTSSFSGTGGLVGVLRGVNKHIKLATIQNCYSSGIVTSPNIKGGVIGYVENGYIYNCYSVAQHEYEQVGNQELSTLDNNEVFSRSNGNWILRNNIVFDEDSSNNLLDVLNLGVRAINTHGLRSWLSDTTNENLPILGDTIEVSCENVSNVVAHNIVANGTQAVEISWTENGSASMWEIQYGIQSNAHIELCDTLYRSIATTNPDTLFGLSGHNGETCIINVRPICDTIHRGAWSRNCLHNVDKPYWTDVVTSQPAGYTIDDNGNVIISSAEGLAWLISVVNGENGQEFDNMSGRTITLTNDVDMSQYRWKPLGVYGGFVITGAVGAFQGSFDGTGHIISGLRINENNKYVGMFSLVNNSTIKNLTLDSCIVTGTSYVGALVGFAERTNVENCNVNATVNGIDEVGGILGAIRITSTINHCGFNGEVSATRLCGGIVGSVNNNIGGNNGIESEVTISNCWSKGVLGITDEIVGGLIGLDMHYCKLYNSYSLCDIVSGSNSGGLVGYCYGSEYGYYPILENCYYASMNNNNNIDGMLLGYAFFRTDISNCYALGNGALFVGYTSEELHIQNVSKFTIVDSIAQLQSPVMVYDSTLSNLRDALNFWVQSSNDNLFYLWQQSTDTISYPVFGNQLEVSCQFPQVIVDTIWENGVRLKWNSIDDTQSWEVEYGLWCFERGSGNSIIINDTVLILNNLALGEKYDVYIRSNCGDAHSKWVKTTIKTDKLYWKDIVTSQPEGWVEDENGNIFIYTPEALAWLITYSENHLWTEHTIHIMNNLDISRYKWTTFGQYYMQWNIEGHGHTISGLYIDEEQNEIAFIHTLYNAYIKDLFFDSSYVRGQAYAAIICHNNGGEIINCGVRGRVVGYQSLGGLASINSYAATISNTFSNCEIIINSYGADFGGFCSINYGELKNCYSSSQMIIDSAYYARCQHMGIFTGEDYSNNSSENIAYWRHDNSSFINGVAYGDDGYYAFEEGDSSFTIVNPPLIDGSTHSDLIDALNAWVDANNANGQYRHWEADSANVNDGFPVFAAIPCLVINVHDTVVACEDYTWNGVLYNSSILVTDTLSTMNGCDSIVSLHLTINNPVHTATIETACDSYVWNGDMKTANGEYTYTHLDTNGCTQVDTLHLTINHSTAGDTTATACENFTWHGTTYTESTQNSTFTIQNSNGCDSVVTLHLTINNPVHTAAIETACETFTWNNTAYTTSGNYTFSHFDDNSCTQVDTLYLTINNPVHTATTETACESYNWNNTTYTTSSNYTFSHLDVNGCTQVDTLHLTINIPIHSATTEAACDSYTWNNTAYTTSGNYTYSHVDANGCTQVDTLHLTINNPVHTATTETVCESYSWNNTAYTTSGNYTFSHLDTNGCTQVDTLHLTINNPVHIATTEITCDSYIWNNTTYTTSGNYTFSHFDANGCTHVDTLHLTINYSTTGDTTATACENFTWHGTIYTESTQNSIFTIQNSYGCDSVVTLHLTINNPVHTATTETACESYTWNGTAYTASGNYTYSHTDANGCTQVDTLHLTINTPIVTDVYDTACDNYTWFGTTYTATGDYVRTGTSALPGGCDTTETLHLTINHSVTIFDTLSLLSNEMPYNYHGNTINSEGDYTFNGTTIEGCDSTVILYVTVTPVGIFDIQNSEFKIDVFPNPTNGVVTIASEEATRVEVMDASGRKVLTVENNNRIDLSNLPSGVYMLQITTPQGKALKRVIRK